MLLNAYISKRHKLFKYVRYFILLPCDFDMADEHFLVDTQMFWKQMHIFIILIKGYLSELTELSWLPENDNLGWIKLYLFFLNIF